MPAYRYLLCDLLTDRVLASLPLTGVTFERRISRVGELSGTLDAPDKITMDAARLLRAYTGRSALWVFRDSEIWWAGIPWTAPVKQGQRGPLSLDVQAATFDSYADHRLLYADLDYTGIDQGVLMPTLWRTIQTDPRGNIGVDAQDQPTGVLVDRSYAAADQGFVGDLIRAEGDLAGGPEHTIDTYLDANGNRQKRFRLAVPRLGISEPRVVFSGASGGGGRVLEWSETANAAEGGTAFVVRGDSGSADAAISERLYADDLLAQGWPLLDVTEDRSGVEDDAQLAGYVSALRAGRAGAVRTNTYTVQVGDAGWSPNRLGDPVRIKQADPWHGESDVTVRPVGVKVTAAGTGVAETVELIFGEAA